MNRKTKKGFGNFAKKAVSLALCSVMLFTLWGFVAPLKANALAGGHSQTHTVSNYQSVYASYEFLSEYSVPLDGSNGNPDLCVPGLSSTDDYVPQGMTYCEALDWILISAYPRSGSASSVVYALDASTGNFVAQFNLYRSAGTALSEHVSGIACSENNLYIADHGSTMSYVPVSELNVANGTVKDVIISGTVNLSGELNGANTSYASFANGVLWTGNFYIANNSSYNTMANAASGTIMLGYQLSGASSAAEWAAFSALAGAPSYVIPLDSYGIDRVQCATAADEKVYIGTSYGRKYDSRLYVADLSASGSVSMTVNGRSYQGYTLSNIKNYRHLPMTEGLFVRDGYMYNVFESAAWQYYGYEPDSVCPYPTDVVWKFSTGDLGEGEEEVTGYVTVDPVIYTHGTYTGTNMSNNGRKGQMYDYMMYGDTVADGTVSGECETNCTVSGKTVTSITVLETGAQLSISNGKLTGSMGSAYNNPSVGATATLKFTFTDNTFEQHKVAVMTNPVATHTAVGAFNYNTSWLVFTRRTYSCYLVTATGSYGALSKGTYSYDSNNIKSNGEVQANYAYMYDPYDTNGEIDAWDSDSHLKLDSMTDDAGAFDKKAGYYAYAQWNCNAERNLTANSATATYYIDISTNNNYGVVNSGATYTLQMLIGGIFINKLDTSNDSQSASRTSNSVSVSSGSSTMSIKTNAPATVYYTQQQCGYAELTGTAAVGTTNAKFTTKYTGSHSDVGNSVGIINTNIKLIVSDKTSLRSVFNACTNEKLVSSCYEETGWNNYITAMLNAEAFLNNNTQTDTSTRDSLKSSLQSAHDALVQKDDIDNHPYKYIVKDSTVDPTYYNEGYDVCRCSKCGKTGEKNQVSALQTLINLDDVALEDFDGASGKIALAPTKANDISFEIVGLKSSGDHTLYKSTNVPGTVQTLSLDGARVSTVSGDTGKIAYKFTKMNFTTLQSFYALVKVTGTGNHKYSTNEIYTWQKITLVPAKNVMFDDTVEAITYTNSTNANSGYGVWSRITDSGSTVTDATDSFGDIVTTQTTTENSVKYSFGDAHKVSVSNTLNKAWPTAQFTFTGSGFDVISVTDSNSGVFGVKVYSGTGTAAANQVNSRVVDTYYGYSYTQLFYNQRTRKIVDSGDENGTVLYAALSTTPEGSRVYAGIGTIFYTMDAQYAVQENGSPVIAYGWLMSASSDVLYQVPCISMDLGSVGTYTVVIQPMFTEAFGHFNENGDVKYYNFIFDGIRIYNPADGSNQALAVYAENGERYTSYEFVRESITDADLVLIDGKNQLSKNNIAGYLAGSPKNELYLMKNGSAAFDVDFTDLTDARLGLRAANGTACSITITKGNTARTVSVTSATEQYISLKEFLTAGETATITVTNNGNGILSLTRLMTVTNTAPATHSGAPRRYLSVGQDTAENALAAVTMLNADIAIDESTVETAAADDGTVTITLRSGADAETIVVRDADGNVIDPESITYTLDETGVKNWTVVITAESEGEITYTLQAEYENGYAPVEPTAVTVTVRFADAQEPDEGDPILSFLRRLANFIKSLIGLIRSIVEIFQ